MTFSEAYLTLCIENAEMLREEWKKRGWKPDDWFYNPKHEEVHLLAHSRTHDIWFRDAPKRFARFLEHNIPLPSQRHLQMMLEERGWSWVINGFVDGLCRCALEKRLPSTDEQIISSGPDPETALLRCLVEAVEE